MLCIGRFSIKFSRQFGFGYFDHKILDCKGLILGWLIFGWWYDDIPEGLKPNGAKIESWMYM